MGGERVARSIVLMKSVVVTVVFFLLALSASAADFSSVLGQMSQLGAPFADPNAGQTAFPSLLIPSGGLYEAMGTAYTAIASGPGYINANPSASSRLRDSELSFLHNNWIADSRLEGVVYSSRYNNLGYGIAGKFVYLPFTAYNDWGDRVSSGYYSESIATANISYNFLSSYYFSGISVGANFKAAYRHVPTTIYAGQSALTGMVDLGVLSKFNFLKFYASRERNFSVGATVNNLGLYAEGDPLPTYASIGIAYSPLRPLTLALDFNYPFSLTPATNPADQWNIASGLKLAITKFFTVAGGFRYQGGDPRLSLGSQINLKKISLVVDYTLDLTTQVNQPDHFSVAATINLGDNGRAAIRNKVEKYYLAGLNAYAAGKLEEAISYWDKALKLDPTFQPAAQYKRTAEAALKLETKLQHIRRDQ